MTRARPLGAALALLALLAAAGCDRKSEGEPAPAALPGAAVPDDQIPTPEDFDQVAFERITPRNADEELAKLERAIDQGR